MLAPAAQMGVAKSDFSQMCRSRSDLIMNVEHFAGIDLDLKKNATNVDGTPVVSQSNLYLDNSGILATTNANSYVNI